MNKKGKKRKKIFDHYLQALNVIFTNVVDFAICPLCLNRFNSFNDFSLEHVPPESQGGKDILITCRICNSKAGYTIDNQLHKQELVKNFYENLENSRKIKFNLPGVSLNSSIEHKLRSQFIIKISKDNNHPENIKKFEAVVSSYNENNNWHECNFSINKMIKYNPFQAEICYLKSAYLIAFVQFGYRYIFRDELQIVREQINNYKTRTINGFFAKNEGLSEDQNYLIILDEPFKALAVKFGNKYIFLPFLESKKNFYKSLSKYDSTNLEIRGTKLSVPTKTELLFDFVKI
ncbi:hypothetical protein KAR48_12320 [bacterium]|nr:hypothetical protein [bacterium]